MAGPKKLKIALAGKPNSGKSSLFNQLTGLNQKIGNFPGITVDKRTGICQLNDHTQAEIIDLPGIYSLYPRTLDEKIVAEILADQKGLFYPDCVVLVADATNLKNCMLLMRGQGPFVALGWATRLSCALPSTRFQNTTVPFP